MEELKGSRLNLDFVAGLIVGEGSFYWTRVSYGKIPAFALRMHVRDKALVEAVRNSLGLKAKVREYIHDNRHYVSLAVREIGPLKNIIIPTLYPRLFGYKKLQFLQWFMGFFAADAAEGFKFFPNALRLRFPELCDENTLTKMIEREQMGIAGIEPAAFPM